MLLGQLFMENNMKLLFPRYSKYKKHSKLNVNGMFTEPYQNVVYLRLNSYLWV